MIENMSEIYMTGIKRNDCLYESELLACCQSASERMLGGNIESFLACEKPCERRIFMQHSLCDNFKHESELMAIGFGLFSLSHTLGSAFCCDSKLFSCCRMLGMVKWGGECIYRAGEKGNFILLCFLPCTGE